MGRGKLEWFKMLLWMVNGLHTFGRNSELYICKHFVLSHIFNLFHVVMIFAVLKVWKELLQKCLNWTECKYFLSNYIWDTKNTIQIILCSQFPKGIFTRHVAFLYSCIARIAMKIPQQLLTKWWVTVGERGIIVMASNFLRDMKNTKWCNGLYFEFRQNFPKETFSYDEHLKS